MDKESVVILISDIFLTKYPPTVTALQENHNISCIDCPLEFPITFIIDEFTAISIVDFTAITIKVYIKGLAKCAYKFQNIWILVILSSICDDSMSLLFQSVSQFPADCIIRTVRSEIVGDFVNKIYHETASSRAISSDNMSVLSDFRTRARSFIENVISNPVSASHCEFLQLFPTINLFIACKLLSNNSIRELCALNTWQLLDLCFGKGYKNNNEDCYELGVVKAFENVINSFR